MVNKIYFKGRLVIDIVREKRNKKIFILEDKTKISVSKNKFNIICTKCGRLSNEIFIYNGRIDKPYICFGCNQNKIWIGRKHTENSKIKQSEKMKGRYSGKNNPMYGKHIKDYMTLKEYDNWRKNISESSKGNKNGFYGKHHSQEAINKIILKNKLYNNRLTQEEKLKRSKKISIGQKKAYIKNPLKYIDNKRKAAFASLHSQGRFIPSKPELKVKEWLERNSKYKFNPIILGHYQYDFGNRELRILIEVQGDYWHGNKNMFNIDGSEGKRKLNLTQLKKMKIDEDKKLFALNHGFKYIEIWENDINKNNFSALENIKNDRVY